MVDSSLVGGLIVKALWISKVILLLEVENLFVKVFSFETSNLAHWTQPNPTSPLPQPPTKKIKN